jgi:hypothetical protein
MEPAGDKAFFEACPECGGDVHKIARRCKHCGADLQAAQPAPAPAPIKAAPAAPAAPVQAAPDAPSAPPQNRKLLIAGAAVMIFAVGMAAGILVERAGDDERPAATPAPMAQSRRAPQRPVVPDFDVPDDPNLDVDTYNLPGGGTGFTFRFGSPSVPSLRSRRPRPGRVGDGPDVETFVKTLGGEVCTKLSDCTDVDPAIGMLCSTLTMTIPTDDVAARVDSGECSYDAMAAGICLDGLQSIDCSDDTPTDPFAMLSSVDAIMSCLEALRC